MTEILATKYLDFGAVGALLIVINWGMKLLVKVVMARRGLDAPVTTCTDPMMIKQVEEIHEQAMSEKAGIDRGDFSCAWHGRDEVRDLMETMRSSVAATKELTREMRLTRNGGG